MQSERRIKQEQRVGRKRGRIKEWMEARRQGRKEPKSEGRNLHFIFIPELG